MSGKKQLNLLFISIGLFGFEGSMVNERELVKALNKIVTSLYVITFVPVNKYPKYLKNIMTLRNLLDHKLIIIPNFITPPINNLFSIMNLFYTYLNSIIALMVALILKKASLVDAVYIRDPRMAIAFFSPIKIFDPILVKFGGFYTEDMVRPQSFAGDFLVNLFKRINCIVVNKADIIITHNKLFEPILRKLYDLKDDTRYLVIPPGINSDEIPIVTSRDSNLSVFRVGYVGSISEGAGLDVLIDAMIIVRRVMPNVVLDVVIGSGNRILIDEIKTRIKRLKLNAFFSGPLSHIDALKVMGHLNALVVPRKRTLSAELTIPIKVIEAFALGVPVIITRHKVFEENYVDGEEILLVEPEPMDLAQKIIMLLTDHSLSKIISERGLLNSREFDYNFLASRLIGAISELSQSSKHKKTPD